MKLKTLMYINSQSINNNKKGGQNLPFLFIILLIINT